MFSAQQRLRTTKDIHTVYTQGKKTHHKLMRLMVLPSKYTYSRATVVVSKRVSNKAIVRNKLKRQVRSLLQEHIDELQNPSDVVVVLQPPAAHSTYEELSNALSVVFSKHRI